MYPAARGLSAHQEPMPDPVPTPPDGGKDGQPSNGPLTEERVVELVTGLLGNTVNAAVTNHLKRVKQPQTDHASIEKLVSDAVSKAVAGLSQKPDSPAPDGNSASRVDPLLEKANERIEKLEKAHQEAIARAVAVEKEARREKSHAALRMALEVKGITGAKARMVIADLEQNGAVRYEDDGSTVLTVRRARIKGAPATDQEYNITAAGTEAWLEDWSKLPDAQEIIPPPQPAKQPFQQNQRRVVPQSFGQLQAAETSFDAGIEAYKRDMALQGR